MSPGSEGCLRGPAGFDTIHPQSPVVTGEVCAPTNLVFLSLPFRGGRFLATFCWSRLYHFTLLLSVMFP